MTDGWTCARCGNGNVEASLICAACGLTRPDDELGATSMRGVDGSSATDGLAAAGALSEAPPTTDAPVPGWVAPGGTAGDEAGGAPSPPVPLWRRIPLGWLLVAVIVVGAGITGWYFNASRSSTGEITKQGDMTAVDLRVGDCFDLKDPAAEEINDVTAIPCSKEHEFELSFSTLGSIA